MTVAELIAKLQKLPQDAEVCWVDEDEGYFSLYYAEEEDDNGTTIVTFSGDY